MKIKRKITGQLNKRWKNSYKILGEFSVKF